MPKVAVILAGCGRMDGSEVHESTLSLLYLEKGGAEWMAFAPNENQVKVINHLTNKPEPGATRNQMVESARIARGNVRPLAELNVGKFDALVVPGGGGGFQNLGRGPGGAHPELRRALRDASDAGKPIAAICIAPVLVARVLGDLGPRLTIGNDAATAAEIEKCGARHVACAVDACVADEERKIVTTPAYMLGPGIADVAAGIEACIAKLLGWL